jgi:hypothetical protein
LNQLNNPEPVKTEEKKWWTKTKVSIITITSVLILLGLIVELPQKIYNSYYLIFNDESVTSNFKGIVTNNLGNLIEGAVLKLDLIPGDSVISTSSGSFYFAEVPGKPGDRVRLFITCDGYRPHNEYVTLPGPVTIMLEE